MLKYTQPKIQTQELKLLQTVCISLPGANPSGNIFSGTTADDEGADVP